MMTPALRREWLHEVDGLVLLQLDLDGAEDSPGRGRDTVDWSFSRPDDIAARHERSGAGQA